MGDLVIPVLVVGLLVFGVVDVVTSDASAVRNLPKLAWLLLVILLMPIGTLVWLFLGRPRPVWEPATAERASRPRPRPRSRRPVEDDPDEIVARIEARDRLLQQWAEEDRAKRRGAGAGDSGADPAALPETDGEERRRD